VSLQLLGRANPTFVNQRKKFVRRGRRGHGEGTRASKWSACDRCVRRILRTGRGFRGRRIRFPVVGRSVNRRPKRMAVIASTAKNSIDENPWRCVASSAGPGNFVGGSRSSQKNISCVPVGVRSMPCCAAWATGEGEFETGVRSADLWFACGVHSIRRTKNSEHQQSRATSLLPRTEKSGEHNPNQRFARRNVEPVARSRVRRTGGSRLATVPAHILRSTAWRFVNPRNQPLDSFF
jgi:hypothetical protein